MAQEPFAQWLTGKSWAVGVRYCKAVLWMLPVAALALDVPLLFSQAPDAPAKLASRLAWQLAVAAVCLAVLFIDRFLPRWRGRESTLYLFCGLFMALTTWVGVTALARGGSGMAIYAAGSTFIAAAICTPRPVRRPMYLFSLAVLATPVWLRTASVAAVAEALITPLCVVVLCLALDRFSYSQTLALYNQTARADRVLYNMLPVSVAEELKDTNEVKARQFDTMGVLFADIVGFTAFSRSLSPEALVRLLNQVFSAFDEQVARRGLEKVKTIGDAYMAISYDRIDALCELALELHRALGRCNAANGTALSLRIGVHAGPVVAGVIGTRRFSYDVWGDTVNVASRMEAAGKPGRIHVSEAVYLHAREYFEFDPRGQVPVKDCGEMETWWLVKPKAPENIVL